MSTRLVHVTVSSLDYNFFGFLYAIFAQRRTLAPRKGVIMECPQNDLFHDPRDVILSSPTAIKELDDDDDDDKWT